MHFLLYEFVTGGGWLFVESNRSPQGTLLREGLAMISAVATDFATLADSRVTIFWDARLTLPTLFERLANCRVVLIHSSGEHDEQLARIAASADRTLLIAPEFDQHLVRACRLASAAGGRLISPALDFVSLTSDKHLTIEHLVRRGVQSTRGVSLQTGGRLPKEFQFPAVLKPRDGAGSQGIMLLAHHPGEDFFAETDSRLETFIPGQAVSVAAICGPAGCFLLPPCSQRLSNDGRFTYLGGETPLSHHWSQRTIDLATRTLAALPPACGYVGIDMVLGDCEREDAVIEVNPRLTTSYVGLRAIVRENLASAMLHAVAGTRPVLSLRSGKLEYTADGQVKYIDHHE